MRRIILAVVLIFAVGTASACDPHPSKVHQQ